MEHIFVIHSHTLFLSSLGVINKLGLKEEDVLFLFHRHYKTIIPFNYKWIDISDEFEETYYILLSWSRKHFLLDRHQRKKSLDFFDKLVDDNVKECYCLYIPHLQGFAYQILATNKKCKECFYVQEGGRVMLSCLTDKIAWVWRLYNRFILKNDKRLWKCTNWFPNENTPYNKPVTVYTFDSSYYGTSIPKANIHIEWPNIDINIDINEDYPIFLLDGSVELGQVELNVYNKALRKMISEQAKMANYVKFHPMQSNVRKQEIMKMFTDLGLTVSELSDEVPFELIVVKYKNLNLLGFGTSLLFYGRAYGHHVISYEMELIGSRRYRMYSKDLPKL